MLEAMKHNEYIMFENIRQDSAGGGLLTAVHKILQPVCVSDVDEVEVLVVEGKVNNCNIRFINAYAPQEEDSSGSKEELDDFFFRLDFEEKFAKLAGTLVCLELDANSKLGKDLIQGDPHSQSKNGEMLARVIDENFWTVFL